MDPKLLELLVCPVTKGHLDYDRDRSELLSRSARLAYPIRDGIPILLEEQARTLSDDELEQIGGDVHVLVAGSACTKPSFRTAAGKVVGLNKVRAMA